MRSPDEFSGVRADMVREQLLRRGISGAELLAAFSELPRHNFVADSLKSQAYSDSPLPIGFGQTISQPYIAAFMTQLLNVRRGDKVLEIGTGSGYQTAVLAFIGAKVYTVERKKELLERARSTLSESVLKDIGFLEGDGSAGWPENAPYDGIIVTAGSPDVPPPLLDQLARGGRMVIPVGVSGEHEMMLYIKDDSGVIRAEKKGGCAFVPLLGRYAGN